MLFMTRVEMQISVVIEAQVPNLHHPSIQFLIPTRLTIVTQFLITISSRLAPCCSRRLIRSSLANIQAQYIGIQVQFIVALLEDLSDVLGILEFPQINIRS